MQFRQITAMAAVTAAAALFSAPAAASFTSCVGSGYDISGKVSSSTNCTILNPLGGGVNDSVSGAASTYTVNVEQFFGINTWLFDGKYDSITSTSGTDGSALYNFTGGSASGTWTKSALPSGTDRVMFIFKDGGSTNLVGYLMDISAASGTYASPFTEPPFSFPGTGPRAISHISVYYTKGSTTPPLETPEPGSLALMGAAALGLWAVRRRRSA